MNAAPYAYAQARLQARYARLPDAVTRHRLDGSGSYGHLLQALRRTELRGWVAGIAAAGEVHAIEAHLRRIWREEAAKVAAWMPPEWRSAIAWLRWLPDLAALAHLISGAGAPRWVRQDPLLRRFAEADPRRRRAALAESELAPLAAAEPPGLPQAWLAAWRRRWPEPAPALAALADALARLHAAQAEGDALPAAPTRDQAEALLRQSFRAHPFGPVAAAAYLGLAALDLAWLNGALVSRSLFGREEAA